MQTILAPLSHLLAQTQALPGGDPGFLEQISENHNKGFRHELPWELLLVGVGATLTAIVVVSLRRRWLKRQENPSPFVLFSAIARKAGLNWKDRLLLVRIAKANRLPTPITLLLARGALRHYAEAYLRRRGKNADPKINSRLKHIETLLHG
ncbi:MAG: hypothetical protein ACPGYV_01620 [Phycisphaeraceae bacterium]